MLFLLLGLGILAASAASWARLLSDQDFSDAIFQDGLLSFWWNGLMVLIQQPDFLVSTPSMAIPLLVAAIGPFIGLPLAGVGGLAIWRQPKEIEVQGRARGPAGTKVFQGPASTAKPKPVFGGDISGGERQRQAQPVRSEPDFSKKAPMEETRSSSVPPVVGGDGQKIARIGNTLAGAIAALEVVVAGLASRVHQKVLLAAKRRTEKQTTTVAAQKEAEHTASTKTAPVEREEVFSKDEQPLPERIMAWYAAWVTVRAGQRPPRMLEDARRLAAELDADTRLAMTGFGMRGATALSMLESAAAAGMMRGAEEEDFLPPPRAEVASAAAPDVDEFMREVEAPEADEGVLQESTQRLEEASGPVLIEDDIAPPAKSWSTLSYPSEETGPMVIEGDIRRPSVDKDSSNMAEEMAARRLMGVGRSEEIAIPIEESEFLPAPGTVEPSDVGGRVVATATTEWDEIEISAPAKDTAYPQERVAAPEVRVPKVGVEGFIDVAGGISETPVATAIEPADGVEVEDLLAKAGGMERTGESSVEVTKRVEMGPKILPEEETLKQGKPSLRMVAEPVALARNEPRDEAVVEQKPAEARRWPPFGGPPIAQEGAEKGEAEAKTVPAPVEPAVLNKVSLVAEDGWPARINGVEAVGSSETRVPAAGIEQTIVVSKAPVEGEIEATSARSEPARLKEVEAGPVVVVPTEAAEPEAEAERESVGGDDIPEAFPSGVTPEVQEAVIGAMLSDPRRRATILGEREGTPAWTLRRLELYGLLGLSDKSNAAVVRMWEALDRLVSHQARVFAWENLGETPPPAFATHEQRAAHVVNLAREVVAERARVGPDLLSELRSLKAGTEHVAWMDDRVDSLLAAMTSAKVAEELKDFLPKPEEDKAQAGGRLLKVMTGRREPEVSAIIESSYEELLAASHDIHQRYKEICKGLMVPLYRSLSVKVKEEDGRPAYAQIELVLGDVASIKQRNATQEGAIGVIFVLVPAGRWQVAEAAGRAGHDRLVLEGVGENAGRLLRIRDRSLDIFRRWVEGRNMRAFGVVHLLCEEGAVVDGIDRRWGDVEFVRNPWGQKDLEAIQKSRLRPKA